MVRNIDRGGPEEGAQVVIHGRGERPQSESEWLSSGGFIRRFVPPRDAVRWAPDEHGLLERNLMVLGPDAGLDPETRLRSGDVNGDAGRFREDGDRLGTTPCLHQGEPQGFGFAEEVPQPPAIDGLEPQNVFGIAVHVPTVGQPAERQYLFDQKQPLGGPRGPASTVSVVVKIGPRNPRSDPVPVATRCHRADPDPCDARIKDQFKLKPDLDVAELLGFAPVGFQQDLQRELPVGWVRVSIR
ncbi:MAG TPA: hypothetical protein VNE42_02035 [Acidimicrobiales bacterium]|nr:hypothetical protein [Acidimicrobiales bacterium]